MHLLVRAVISGFGFTLGAALFRKVSKQLGLEDPLWVGLAVPATQPAPPAPPEGEPTS
ncbi:MAG: hypothetical protein K8M05_30190 [Deltaproteobacteria bacterium]|nr:hypothetical protein [Kofleriaceae bacterium]